MADVFVSYAAEDRDRAAKLASALTALGWSVWWDRRIVAGQTFDQAIERELDAAKSVVVLWSRHSIQSEWVKNEAAAAAERNVLVPAAIDKVKLPLEFRRRQTADLVRWHGESEHVGYRALCEGVAVTIGCAVPPSVAAPTTEIARGLLRPATIGAEGSEGAGSVNNGGRRLGWRAVGLTASVLAVVAIAAVVWVSFHKETQPDPLVKAVPATEPVPAPKPAGPATPPAAESAPSVPATQTPKGSITQTEAPKVPISKAAPATQSTKPASGEDCRMEALSRLQRGEVTVQRYKELVAQCR